MKSIIEREATFENNSDMEVKVTQKQLSRAFVKEDYNDRPHTIQHTSVDYNDNISPTTTITSEDYNDRPFSTILTSEDYNDNRPPYTTITSEGM